MPQRPHVTVVHKGAADPVPNAAPATPDSSGTPIPTPTPPNVPATADAFSPQEAAPVSPPPLADPAIDVVPPASPVPVVSVTPPAPTTYVALRRFATRINDVRVEYSAGQEITASHEIAHLVAQRAVEQGWVAPAGGDVRIVVCPKCGHAHAQRQAANGAWIEAVDADPYMAGRVYGIPTTLRG
jgi:hypothetical protein